MATVADLRNKALTKLTIIGNGQTASPDDAAIVEDAITELHAELEERDLAYWGGITDIPNAAIPHFIKMLIPRISDEFSKYEQIQELKAEQGERMIRELENIGLSGEPVPANYF